MSGDVTFQELIDESKDRADMVGSSFISDSQWEKYINKSKDVLYNKLVSAYGNDYYTKDADITMISGQGSYDLPSDFFKLTSVEIDIGGAEYIPLKRFDMRNRSRGYFNFNRYHNTYRYRLLADKIHFTPQPSNGTTIKIWYVPLATNLASPADTLKGYSGWEEYIILDAAIKAMRKEESDTADLERDRAVFDDQLKEIRHNRDAANPKKVKDVSSGYSYDDETHEGF